MNPRPIPFVPQPDGSTCGPACLAMVGEALGRGGFTLDVHNVASMCGTTHEGVGVALAGLGIQARRSLGRQEALRAFAEARPGDMVLCRTLTQGVRHWVLSTPAAGGFRLLDPWLGEASVDVIALERLIAPRDHEVWSIDGRQRVPVIDIGPLLPGDGRDPGARDDARALCLDAFGKHATGIGPYLDGVVDWGISRAVRMDGRIAAVYLLNEDSLATSRMPMPHKARLSRGRTVEGVALVSDPEHRGKGYGRLLRDEPARLGYDHVWGEALHALGNQRHWMRHRHLIHRTEEAIMTAVDLDGPVYDHVAALLEGRTPSP